MTFIEKKFSNGGKKTGPSIQRNISFGKKHIMTLTRKKLISGDGTTEPSIQKKLERKIEYTMQSTKMKPMLTVEDMQRNFERDC